MQFNKEFFNLVKFLFKAIERLYRNEKLQIGSKAEQKVFSNIVKDIFNSIERLCRSGKIQIGSRAERIIVLGSLRKKYLTRCLILRSKDYLKTVYQKAFFKIVKVLFKSIERLCRNTKTQICSKAEGIIVLGSLRKKYLTRCLILRSKDYLKTV